METDATGARAQLSEFEAAVDSSTRDSLRLPSWWAFPLIALIGPALVLVSISFPYPGDLAATPDQPLLTIFRVLAVVLGIIAAVAGFKEWRRERANPVRPQPPIRGGQMTKWLFAFSFSNVLGLIIPLNMLTINNYEHPIRLAIGSYLWMALVPIFFYRRHVKAVRGR